MTITDPSNAASGPAEPEAGSGTGSEAGPAGVGAMRGAVAGPAGFYLAAAAAFAVEAQLTVAWADGALPGGGWTAAAGHLATTAALAAWARFRLVGAGRFGADVRLDVLLVLATAFMGAAGAVCAAFCAGALAVFRRYATGFQDWYLSLFPENQTAPAQELYELIVAGRERAGAAVVSSFTDVMTVGSPQQKQAVVALVARYFRPAFTPALKLGLADADPSVRVQAATATARVEHEFNERWLTLSAAVEARPDDGAARYALARHLDDYAFCGLLDAGREQELRRKALDGYREALARLPDDAALRNDTARLLLRVGLAAEAAETLAPVVAEQGPGARDRRALAWYAESLFRLGRFDELRALCRLRGDALHDREAAFDPLGDVADLWSGDGDDPAPPRRAGVKRAAA